MSKEPELTPQLHALFATLVESASGLHYSARDRAILASKLAMRASEAGFDSLLDYYYRLRYDDRSGRELRELLESLAVHETYFFRELPPLTELVDGYLAATIERRGRARVWSAACATGEEPLTLAMLLAERGLLDRVDLVASDLSEHAIARARVGRHGRRALRDGYPEALARRYLDVTSHGIVSSPSLAAAVDYRVVNLVDDAAVAALGTFDAILCRNVLIYFADAEIVRTVHRLAGALAAGGVLAVGVSESLLRFGTALRCEERAGCFFYRSAA